MAISLSVRKVRFTIDSRANERKRRQVYRGEVHALLPFDTKGMDTPVPAIDFSPVGSSDLPYSLQRADIDGKVCSHKLSIHELTRDV